MYSLESEMAGKSRMGKGWQYRFERKGLLERAVYKTFEDEAEGDRFAQRCEHLLAQGIVPAALKDAEARIGAQRVATIAQLVRHYLRETDASDKDLTLLGAIAKEIGDNRLSDVSVNWVDEWVATLKREKKLSPATISARVGALARAVDWGLRKGHFVLDGNPLRAMPMGYAQYSPSDVAAAGMKVTNAERDRRLADGEYEAIAAVIATGELPRKLRPRQFDRAAVQMLVDLALESGMRMREMYTLTTDQIDFGRRTIFLDKTKNGDKRQVPMTTTAAALLRAYMAQRDAAKMKSAKAVFPFWNGSFDRKYLHQLTNEMSLMFAEIFELAGCPDLHFHDLRHEAT